MKIYFVNVTLLECCCRYMTLYGCETYIILIQMKLTRIKISPVAML